jgi:protocatechuate 3,4-dioxygenase beta subunit
MRRSLSLLAAFGLVALAACKGDYKLTQFNAYGDLRSSAAAESPVGVAGGDGASPTGDDAVPGDRTNTGSGSTGSLFDDVGPGGFSTDDVAVGADRVSKTPTTEKLDKYETPSEKPKGTFPADGTDGPNALLLGDIVRRDVRVSSGPRNVVPEGVPLKLTLTVVDGSSGKRLEGKAVYLWQADGSGRYSQYSAGFEEENFLRGVQVTDESGEVTFETSFPGAEPGRWPHLNIAVFDSLKKATNGRNATKVTQLAMYRADCDVVYSLGSYATSKVNFDNVVLRNDVAFGDGSERQALVLDGSAFDGFAAAKLIGI